ncbi:hypothetical protein ABPG74_003820 [Tetrahymena malaccensis]
MGNTVTQLALGTALGSIVLISAAIFKVGSLSYSFTKVPMSISSQQYDSQPHQQNSMKYELVIKQQDQIKSDGYMSFKILTDNGQQHKISFSKLSEFQTVIYKCDNQKNRFHAGILLENNFKVSCGQELNFSYCLVHLYVNANKQTRIKVEFKNNSDFSNELGQVLSSNQGNYKSTNQQTADKTVIAEKVANFVNTIIKKQLTIQDFNCTHFACMVEILLSGEDIDQNQFAKLYEDWLDNLPDEIKQMKQ